MGEIEDIGEIDDDVEKRNMSEDEYDEGDDEEESNNYAFGKT